MSKTADKLNQAVETVNAAGDLAKAVKNTVEAVKGLKFTVKSIITIPLLKPAIDVPFYVRLDTPVILGKKIDDTMEAAHLCNVTNLETGEQNQLIIPSVLLSLLHETYEKDGYVGRSFMLTKHAKPSGKKYHPFSMAEIEVEDVESEKAE